MLAISGLPEGLKKRHFYRISADARRKLRRANPGFLCDIRAAFQARRRRPSDKGYRPSVDHLSSQQNGTFWLRLAPGKVAGWSNFRFFADSSTAEQSILLSACLSAGPSVRLSVRIPCLLVTPLSRHYGPFFFGPVELGQEMAFGGTEITTLRTMLRGVRKAPESSVQSAPLFFFA